MLTSTKPLTLTTGTPVMLRGRRCTITRILDLEQVLVRDAETQQVDHAKVAELAPVPAVTPFPPIPDVATIPDEDWEVAQKRFSAIEPLLDLPQRTRPDVTRRAEAMGLHTNTLYKWLRMYEASGLLTALIPKTRSDKGVTRLSDEVEAVISTVIEAEYLTRQKKSKQKVCNEVRRICLNADLTPPHQNTILNRLGMLSAARVTAKRQGSKAAANKYDPIEGKYPGADWPLAVVQIDHTPGDIILVDDLHRRAVGRPWITMAIDVFSRMVVGFYLSFDPPGALGTGLCIAHAILPKDNWLAKRGLSAEWPCWGLPRKLFMDNAREFRGNMLQRACKQYGIDLEWRPVARPHFGGHIERLLGTLATEIHTLPGTTFANSKERGDYDSAGKAVMTISEFENWLTIHITKVYHQRLHDGIGMAPLEKYRQGIFGSKEQPGTGLPARITDEDRLRLDFMPFEERTVQPYGVVIDEIYYYHDVLRRWINAPDPKSPKLKRKFMFRRDPRDISLLWFYDPELEMYYPIPYRDTSHPPISIWELREAHRRCKADGRRHIDERAIFEAYEEMQAIVEHAQAKTITARRATQRHKMGLAAPKPGTAVSHTVVVPEFRSESTPPTILPFDDLDEQ